MEASAGTVSSELLGLAPPGVTDEEGTVVRDEGLADLERRRGVLVLGDVRDDGLGDGLAERVDLRRVSSSRDTEADVHAREGSRERRRRRGERREEDDGLVELGTEDGGAEEREGDSVDLDESLALLLTTIR